MTPAVAALSALSTLLLSPRAAPLRALDLGARTTLADAQVGPEHAATGAPACDCARFAAELADAHALYASRGEGATRPPPAAARDRFRARLLQTYARARCLVDCGGVDARARDDARALLAATAFKSRHFGPTDAAAEERLTRGLDETARCLAHVPAPPSCHLWHGSIRGIRARGSWNPMQLGLPTALLAEFRAARAGAPPGHDPPDGAATRAEASLLLRAPGFAGGDPRAARRLMEDATTSPLYACTVDNRLLFAETLTATGASARAVAELRATVGAGLPTCGDNRYENVLDLDQAARCLTRLEARPDEDPGWDDDCR